MKTPLDWKPVGHTLNYMTRPEHGMFAARVHGGHLVRYSSSVTFVPGPPSIPWILIVLTILAAIGVFK